MIAWWWLLVVVALGYGAGLAWAARAYVLGYQRAEVDLLGDFR